MKDERDNTTSLKNSVFVNMTTQAAICFISKFLFQKENKPRASLSKHTAELEFMNGIKTESTNKFRQLSRMILAKPHFQIVESFFFSLSLAHSLSLWCYRILHVHGTSFKTESSKIVISLEKFIGVIFE